MLQALEFPLGGLTVRVEGARLVMAPMFDAPRPLVSVNDALFRHDGELMASLAFTTVDGQMVLAGGGLYAERRPRWPFDVLRAALGAALGLVAIAPIAAVASAVWRRWKQGPPAATRGLGPLWALAAAVLALVVWAVVTADLPDLAVPSLRSWTVFLGSIAYPVLALVVAAATARAWTRSPSMPSGVAALAVMLAHAGLATYLGWWELVGFRSWTY